MLGKSIIRTDKWGLKPSPEVKLYLLGTVNEYRAYCKALSYVVMAHWPELVAAPGFCAVIHRTSKNPSPRSVER